MDDLPILTKSLQIITGLLGTAIRAFAIAIMFLEAVWGGLLAAFCFWIASDGSTIRGIIAGILAFLLVTVCAFIVAVYFASVAVVRKAVSDFGLGRIVFDSLFNYALGVSGEDTQIQPSTAKVRTHMSRDEVETTLNNAARNLLSDEMPSSTLAKPFFWLAKQIQRISVWATVKVIVKSCSHDGQSVNLFQLRDRLASTIDDGVVAYLKQYFMRLSLTAIIAVSSVSMLLAFGIRQLPW